MIIRANEIVKGDVLLLKPGWRNVLDVWESLGYVHVAASDCTGTFKLDEEVEIGRRKSEELRELGVRP